MFERECRMMNKKGRFATNSCGGVGRRLQLKDMTDAVAASVPVSLTVTLALCRTPLTGGGPLFEVNILPNAGRSKIDSKPILTRVDFAA